MQNEIYNNRQTAIDKSRTIAKMQFLEKMKPCFRNAVDEHGEEIAWTDPSYIKHEELVKAYEEYIDNRSTIYEVKITKIDKAF